VLASLNSQPTRELGVTLAKIGRLKGPLHGGNEFRRSAEIYRQLLVADPESTERVRDFALGLLWLARLAVAEIRPADAICLYKDALIRLRHIAELDELNAVLKYDLVDYWQEISIHDTNNKDLWLSKALEYLKTEFAKGLSVPPARSTHWNADLKNAISLELKRRQELLEQI